MSNQPISLEILNQHLVALGKTGAGKSSAMRVLVEMLFNAGKRVCIIDKKGDWFGLKLGADGKSPGLPFVAFGDFKNPHATDIQITERNGKEIAELVVSGNRPTIIGFRGWMPGKFHKFWIDFCSTVYNKNSSPLWLVIDEVHNYSPKGRVLSPEVGECIYWTNLIAAEGRGIGLRLIIGSQRPAKVHNDLLTSCETLVAMRVTHPSDRAAFGEWLKEYGDDKSREQTVMNSLASMKTGEAFAWSPEAGIFEHIKFPLFKTFDSFASPKDGTQKTLKGWASVDLDEVQEKLAKVVEEAKSNDPAELKKQIAELKRETLKKQPTAGTVDAKAIEKSVIQERKRWEGIVVDLKKQHDRILKPYADFVRSLVRPVGELGEIPTLVMPERPKYTGRISDSPPVSLVDRGLVSQFSAKQKLDMETNGELTNPEQRILDAIAWLNSIGVGEPEQPAVAFLAGYRFGGGAYNNPRGALRTKGLVEYRGGSIRLTHDGKQMANYPSETLTNEQLHVKVMSRLPGPEQKLLKPLIDAYPNAMSNEDLAQTSGYTNGSGGYNNPRGRLRTLGLIEYQSGGMLRARNLLFPENQ